MASEDDDTSPTERRAAISPLLSGDYARPPLSSSVRVEIGATSHRGMLRPHNDDHYLVIRLVRQQETLATSLTAADLPPRFDEYGYAMFVADGLGEGGAGSVASRVALSTVAHMALHYGRWNLRVDPSTASEIFERAERYYAAADAAVLSESGTSPLLTNIATALTVAYSAGDDLFVAHVGHSRAYLFREGALTLLTRDHTIAKHLADTHRPVSVERRAQDLCHILTDAVGARGGHPMVEVERFQLKNGDSVLLCTNGLTDMVTDEQIADVLALRREPREQCAALTDLANRQGGKDNITVVLAQYQIPASPASPSPGASE
jgi:protein phosphatase